jgi:hypothetical protein
MNAKQHGGISGKIAEMKNGPTLPHFVWSLPPEGVLFTLGRPVNEKGTQSIPQVPKVQNLEKLSC